MTRAGINVQMGVADLAGEHPRILRGDEHDVIAVSDEDGNLDFSQPIEGFGLVRITPVLDSLILSSSARGSKDVETSLDVSLVDPCPEALAASFLSSVAL